MWRASLDDFKRPWSERHLYDRMSGEGYYRNACSISKRRADSCSTPAPTADGIVALCSIDPITQIDHSAVKSAMAPSGVLIVDGVFAYRPEINAYWDLRIWIEIDDELSVQRGIERDTDIDGTWRERGDTAPRPLPRGGAVLIREVDPGSFVDVVIDNTDFDNPRLVRRPSR